MSSCTRPASVRPCGGSVTGPHAPLEGVDWEQLCREVVIHRGGNGSQIACTSGTTSPANSCATYVITTATPGRSSGLIAISLTGFFRLSIPPLQSTSMSRSTQETVSAAGQAPGTASARVRSGATIRIADFTTLPNLLSLARIVGVAAAVLLYFAGHPRVTVILGTAACLTDHLDGYLARRLSQETMLGEMLDQAADSFTTAIAMAMLVIAGGFPFVFLLIFLLREFWVATVRRYAALGQRRDPVAHLGQARDGLSSTGPCC